MGCPPILLPSTGAVARIQNTEFSQKKASKGHPQDKRPAFYGLPRKVAHFWTQPLKHTTLQDRVSPKPSKQQRKCGRTVPSSFYTQTQAATPFSCTYCSDLHAEATRVQEWQKPPYLWSWQSVPCHKPLPNMDRGVGGWRVCVRQRVTLGESLPDVRPEHHQVPSLVVCRAGVGCPTGVS